jgi:hypothetical protein
MTQPNVLIQTAGQLEKLFTMVLWKLQKDKSVSLTEQDIKDFLAAHETDAQLIVHGSEDGLRFQVLPQERAAKFIEEYKAAKRGVVLGD